MCLDQLQQQLASLAIGGFFVNQADIPKIEDVNLDQMIAI